MNNISIHQANTTQVDGFKTLQEFLANREVLLVIVKEVNPCPAIEVTEKSGFSKEELKSPIYKGPSEEEVEREKERRLLSTYSCVLDLFNSIDEDLNIDENYLTSKEQVEDLFNQATISCMPYQKRSGHLIFQAGRMAFYLQNRVNRSTKKLKWFGMSKEHYCKFVLKVSPNQFNLYLNLYKKYKNYPSFFNSNVSSKQLLDMSDKVFWVFDKIDETHDGIFCGMPIKPHWRRDYWFKTTPE